MIMSRINHNAYIRRMALCHINQPACYSSKRERCATIFMGLQVAPSHAKDRIKCLRKSYTLMNYFSLAARRGRLGNSVKYGGSFAVPGSPPSKSIAHLLGNQFGHRKKNYGGEQLTGGEATRTKLTHNDGRLKKFCPVGCRIFSFSPAASRGLSGLNGSGIRTIIVSIIERNELGESTNACAVS